MDYKEDSHKKGPDTAKITDFAWNNLPYINITLPINNGVIYRQSTTARRATATMGPRVQTLMARRMGDYSN